MTLPAAAAALAQVVGDVYMRAADPSTTPSLLAALMQCFAADAAHLQLRRVSDSGLVEAHRSAHADLARAASADRLWQLLVQQGTPSPIATDAGSDTCPFILGGRFAWHSGLEVGLAVLREPAAGAFGEADLLAMAQLAPHFTRAAALAGRLAQQELAAASAADLFKEIPAACVITDAAGRCLDANEALQQYLRGTTLRLVTGRLRFEVPEMQQRWEAALAETEVTGVGRAVRLPRPGGGCWRVVLRPWSPSGGQRLILGVLEEQVPEAQLDPQIVGALMNRLTQAESDVLSGLLKGLPAKAIARQRRASVNTVRSQITTILEKTGFKSQKELIASFGISSFGDSSYEEISGTHHANA